MNKKQLFLVIFIFLGFCCSSILATIQMGVVTATNFIGDREVAWRIKIAGEKLGWKVFVDENGGQLVCKMKNLDWVISLLPDPKVFNARCPNYQAVFHPYFFLDEKRRMLGKFEKYDGYLLTIPDRQSIAEGFEKRGKEFHYIPFYPSIYYIPYCEVPINNLVTMTPAWGDRLEKMKFQRFYRMLSNSGFTKFYGAQCNSYIIPYGYMGSIPYDGVSVVKTLQKHGIVLVIHSDTHNHEGIPSGRIFEAAAASTVIISDENPFIKEHFGDSVFYLDTSASAKAMHAQIVKHLDYIYQNSEKAREMAKKAHQIFADKFDMMNQLLQLEALNQNIKR